MVIKSFLNVQLLDASYQFCCQSRPGSVVEADSEYKQVRVIQEQNQGGSQISNRIKDAYLELYHRNKTEDHTSNN